MKKIKQLKINYSCTFLDNLKDFILDVQKGTKQTKKDFTYALKCIESAREINEKLRMKLYDTESDEMITALHEIKEILEDYQII